MIDLCGGPFEPHSGLRQQQRCIIAPNNIQRPHVPSWGFVAVLFFDKIRYNSTHFFLGVCKQPLHPIAVSYIGPLHAYTARGPPSKSSIFCLFRIFEVIVMAHFMPQNKIPKNFFECSVGEHSKVYHHFQEAMEGGEST